MCGRFVLYDVEGIKKKFNIEIKPSFNIAPSQEVLIYDNKPHFMKWSFSPIWAKKDFNLINCRSETMYEKPSFKNTERCVFVLNGWYEWKNENNEKQPYYFSSKGIFFMAGLKNNNGCCIVTKEANTKLSLIHKRQPILLKEKEISNWLMGENFFDSELDNEIKITKISKKVNNPKNNEKTNIATIE